MKKLLFVVLALFAFTAGADNTITSKEYVDGQVSTLQTQIPAKNTNTVVMNTGTAGEIGEKAIYDTTTAYGAQSDALVTAAAFNSAVQNALESEFVCVEWLGDVHDNAHCLLYQIQNAYHPSKNLANFDDVYYNPNYWSVDDTTKTIHGYGSDANFSFFLRNAKQNEIYTISADFLNIINISNFALRDYDDPHFEFARSIFFSNADPHSWSFTIPADGNYRVNIRCAANNSGVTVTNIQIEKGTVATPYVPYGNVYIPQGN